MTDPVHDHLAQQTEPPWPNHLENDMTVPALGAGVVAALVGGLIWAGIGLYANLEIGWAAWGVGILVGLAMGRVTSERSRRFGVAAAGMAAMGLLVGKLLITLGSTGALASDILSDEEYMAGAVAWQLYDAEALSLEAQDGIDAIMAAGDTIPDALWEQMLAQGSAVLAEMPENERRELADLEAGLLVGHLGIVNGIMVRMSPWDLLWFGLAVVTAFQMMGGAKPEVDG